ncbi:hypothetical protein LEP1GSC193_4195 [Leptospira alstonii serovar Pingchang str. 80-412]|uniref:Uncharacterized protein n=3 Tax=Leptospira alstonii TaxID=28452 RepID=M6CRG4_9LEPT|nr:hypothetical protein LEP1GSC194_1852 [Leptospira alstonii serovar Sichuan str. 79601]EQA78471.1 hypothetical protein LEP1GSC193_4195 [Leptospira alstonii serovar Pingchang str. 80-412]
MMRNQILLTILLFLPGILTAQTQSEDPFDELVKEKKEIFGSEKEEKYPVRMLFVDVEKWPGHKSWHAFWFVRRTDYPKFKQFRIFPFYNSIEAKSGKAGLDYLFPIFSYRRVEANGMEEKTFLSPIYYRNTVQPVDGREGTKESTNFYWLGYNSSSVGPGFEKSFLMFPGFFPLFVRKTDSIHGVGSSFTMFLPLLYWNRESSTESTTTFTLFHWGHDVEKKFFSFFPLFHYTNYKTEEDYSFTLFPLYHQSRSNSQKFATYSPLWFHESEKTSDSESDFLFLPIPLFYKSKTVSAREESTKYFFGPLALYFKNDGDNFQFRNLLLFQWGKEKDNRFFRFLPLFYWSGTKNQTDNTFTFFPFVFYKENSYLTLLPLWFYKKNEYKHLFPIFFSWKDDERADNLAGPLFYRYRSQDVHQDYYLNTYYKRERGKGLTELVSFPFVFYKRDSYLTLFPIYHHSIEGDDFTQYFLLPIPMYRHIRKMESETLVLNAYWSRDEKGEYLSSSFFPFYFHKKNSYLHIPFLLFFQTQEGESYKETFLLPFFYRYSTPNVNEFFLLAYHNYGSNSNSFTRLYPFYYSSREKDGSSFLGLAGLFYRWKDSAGETTTRTILPLHYYQKNEYNLWLPFYFRFGGEDRDYVSFSPIHYKLRSSNVDRDWALLYYSSENRKEKTSSLVVAPFYFAWKNPESRGDILLPAYLKYYEKNKNLELYFGGISVSQSGGKFDVSFQSSASGKEFYVDLDYSFIYNIFSVSLRKEVSNPLTFFTDEKKEDVTLPQIQNSKNSEIKKEIRLSTVEEDVPKSTQKQGSDFASYKKLARENSRNYFAWEVLFGIASYQSGDDKKHFRILPLGWFTWGKNNDDHILAFPLPLPTFLGTVGDESYRVVFPLYAEQRKGSDFIRSLGIFLFVMEKEKDRKEYSILWPLIRYAKSKEEVSYRFFPIFTHRETAERLETKSILYYRSREKTGTYETSSFHGILFPLYQASEEIFTKKDSISGSGYGTLIPFYYRDYSDRFVGERQVYKERNFYSLLFLYSYKEDIFLKSKDSFLLSPFYYSSSNERIIFNKPHVSELNLILPIPLFVWGREGDETYKFILGYYGSTAPDRSAWNFLFLFGSSDTKKDKEYVESSYVFPFYFKTRITEGGAQKYKSTTIPFFHSEESRTSLGRIETSFFSPIWFQSKMTPGESKLKTSFERNFYPIPLFFTYEKVTDYGDGMIQETSGWDWLFLANWERRKTPNIQKNEYDFKILLGGIFGYSSVTEPQKESVSWNVSPLFFRKSEMENGTITNSSTLIPIVLYRSYSEKQGKINSHTNFFGILMNYKRNDEFGTKSFFLFPSVYYSNDQRYKEKTFFFLPFVYSSSVGEDQYSFFFMGYYQRKNSVSNRYNFLYLFDLESSLREQKKELTLFLGVFNAEFEKDRTRWGVFGGVLLGYESTPQMTDWNFLWIRYLNSPQERIQNFLPIYRYSETQEGYSFLAPPLLTYHSKDQEGSLTLGGLGIIYYRNRSDVAREESTKILGGLVYFSEKKALRGFQNYGVLGVPFLGGLLWNHEYEEETGFRKTSVLKFVFSRTTYKGKTWNSYFGISPSLWFDKDEDN